MPENPAFQAPTVEVRWPQPDVAVVVLAGEHDLYSAGDVDDAFVHSLPRCGHLIVDLSAVEFIDSTIISILVQATKKATALGRNFNVVLGTAPNVERILDVSGVAPLLNVVPTVEQALA